jgi:hypothetical protein
MSKSKGASAKKNTARASKHIDFGKIPLRQVVALIREQLEKSGYDPVLTGKACAAVYIGSQAKLETVDFVIEEYNINELDAAMKKFGFKRLGMHTYKSAKAPFDIVFLPPPLSVGDDVVGKIDTLRARTGKVKLLTPTDCVRQRLSMYYRWGDKEAFEDALKMSKRYEIDFDLVKKWSEWEWCSENYEEFEKALKENTGK